LQIEDWIFKIDRTNQIVRVLNSADIVYYQDLIDDIDNSQIVVFSTDDEVLDILFGENGDGDVEFQNNELILTASKCTEAGKSETTDWYNNKAGGFSYSQESEVTARLMYKKFGIWFKIVGEMWNYEYMMLNPNNGWQNLAREMNIDRIWGTAKPKCWQVRTHDQSKTGLVRDYVSEVTYSDRRGLTTFDHRMRSSYLHKTTGVMTNGRELRINR
jgi:hypothetical protein